MCVCYCLPSSVNWRGSRCTDGYNYHCPGVSTLNYWCMILFLNFWLHPIFFRWRRLYAERLWKREYSLSTKNTKDFWFFLHDPVAQMRRHDYKSKIVPWIVVRNNCSRVLWHVYITISQTLLVIAAIGTFYLLPTEDWLLVHLLDDSDITILFCHAGICIGKLYLKKIENIS